MALLCESKVQVCRRAGRFLASRTTPNPSQEGNQSSIVNRQSSIPIIALTASAFEEDREKVLNAGCDDFVRKPFQETEIFDMLHKHLGVRFVYEESSKVADSRQFTQEDLQAAIAALPSELVDTLEEAAKFCDMMIMNEVLPEIRRHNAPLADALAQLADNFEYDEILTLIQRGERNTT